MSTTIRTVGTVLGLLTVLTASTWAQGTDKSPSRRAVASRNAKDAAPREPVKPSPLHDDASLNDVALVGRSAAIAVGDRGTVWKSSDGAKSWTFVPTPVSAALRSASFLTDRVGWIVGTESDPYTRLSFGVVLSTRDGGETWERSPPRTLPALVHVHFFDLENGIAAGESSGEHPTGVYITDDGGKTWRSLPGKDYAGWRTACFPNENGGFVAGLQGRMSLVGNGQMIAPRVDDLGQRGLRGVVLQSDNTGWLVGEGALALQTTNGGLVWQEPAKPLPRDLKDFADFHSVASKGSGAWICGSPGSAVWHTPDNGRSWTVQPTGSAAPLHAIRFASETHGVAVGAFGTILTTDDGGATWNAVRGGSRRAAMVGVHAWPGRTSFEWLAKQSADLGYRSAVLIPSRADFDAGGHETIETDLRLSDAVVRAGGNEGELGWRFPLEIPGLEKNSARLLEEWNRRSEGRLTQVFLGSLVASIRTWRPSVIVIDDAPPDDAATSILNDAVRRAVHQAADPTRYLAQSELAALEPWKVERVYLRTPNATSGQASVDPHEFLPRLQRTVREAAAPSLKMLAPTIRPHEGRQHFRLIWERGAEDATATGPLEFFAGLSIGPGSDARREMVVIDEDSERERMLAMRQRNILAQLEQNAADPRRGAQMIAQLRETTAGMRPEQAAAQLTAIADQYREVNRWDLVESTLVDLVERYPDEPAAIDAMRWLFQRWAGAEPAWQRARAVKAGMSRQEIEPDRVIERVSRAVELSNTLPHQRDMSVLDSVPDPTVVRHADGMLQIAPGADWRTGAVKHWSDQAVKMASLMRKRDPALFRQPEIQFPLAALMRQRGVDRFADTIYRKQQQSPDSNPWRSTADAELWLVQPIEQPPKPLHLCKRTPERPVLDGVLSDECWQDAKEIRLRSIDGTEAKDNYAIVLMARDAEYLYLGASFPRHPEAPDDRPTKQARTHDADLSLHDRISLYLDVDRDYATWYALHIDQRGLTADSCWDDESWNPKWFVATDADDTHWRIEVAIPFIELVPIQPDPGAVWSMFLVRTIPAVGLESWTQPAAARPRPETFGLVRFP